MEGDGSGWLLADWDVGNGGDGFFSFASFRRNSLH